MTRVISFNFEIISFLWDRAERLPKEKLGSGDP